MHGSCSFFRIRVFAIFETMTNQFKIPFYFPLPKKRVDIDPDLPRFDNSLIVKHEELGRGSFGIVYRASYNGDDTVVKVMQEASFDKVAAKWFIKEAKLMAKLQCPNIVSFIAMDYEPLSMLMEYACFDFGPLGVPSMKCSSLSEFLSFVNNFQMKTLETFATKIAKDVTNGLLSLHKVGIVHRDLKPSNILVSNQHYCKLHDGKEKSAKMNSCPIVFTCDKLTDFGESRSHALQTQTILQTSTSNLQRGTLPFMAPEQYQGKYLKLSANHGDLLLMDIWQLGMTFFRLLNPDLQAPFLIEYEKQDQGSVDPRQFIARFSMLMAYLACRASILLKGFNFGSR